MMCCCFFVLKCLAISSLIEKYQAVAISTSTFAISFQNSDGLSTDEWVEIDQNIPPLKEFTACHWEKIRYFSSQAMTIWAYCIADKNDRADINCTQIYSVGNVATANQHRTQHTLFHLLTSQARSLGLRALPFQSSMCKTHCRLLGIQS